MSELNILHVLWGLGPYFIHFVCSVTSRVNGTWSALSNWSHLFTPVRNLKAIFNISLSLSLTSHITPLVQLESITPAASHPVATSEFLFGGFRSNSLAGRREVALQLMVPCIFCFPVDSLSIIESRHSQLIVTWVHHDSSYLQSHCSCCFFCFKWS